MKKIITWIAAAVLSVAAGGTVIGCGASAAGNNTTNWFAPMLGLTVNADYSRTGDGATNKLFGTYDAQMYNTSSLPLNAEDFTAGVYTGAAPISKEILAANNAVRMNALLDYQGTESFNVRLRVQVFEVAWNDTYSRTISREDAVRFDSRY